MNTIKLSFIYGPKVEVSGFKKALYTVDFINADTGVNIFTSQIENQHWCASNLKYYVNWNIKVSEQKLGKLINNKFDLANKKVFIGMASAALGDSIAWIPYVEEFQRVHNCRVSVMTHRNELFESRYPNLKFLPLGADAQVEDYFAAYQIGTFDNDYNKNKNNWRLIPLQQVASDMLGLKYSEIKPKVAFDADRERPIQKKYVAISELSTFQGKLWNYPNGWQMIVDWLRSCGYEVMVVSKEPTKLKNIIDATGKTIAESINDIRHSEFYIGVSSGLAWLAWALGIKPVIISGFTEPYSEMRDCVRIINEDVCHGCYNDQHAQQFDRGNWRWCPRNNNFECTTKIPPDAIMTAIVNANLIKDDPTEVPWFRPALTPSLDELERSPFNPEDYLRFHPRVWQKDGWIVDLGCLGWDWSKTFIGKKKVLGADPLEINVPAEGVQLFTGVVGTVNGWTHFEQNDQAEATTPHTQQSGEGTPLISLDSLLIKYNIGQVDILKMNIEGMEYELLINMDRPVADQIIVAFHRNASMMEAVKLHLSQWYTIQQISVKWNWWLFLKKEQHKIKLVHMLNFPDQEVEINSVASIKPLEELGIEYVQQYNPIALELPDVPALHPTNVWGGPLKPGYYGVWEAHRRAIEEEFTSDVDWLIICERDCLLEVSAAEFYQKLQSYIPFLQEHNIAYFSFGDRANPDTGFEESPVKHQITDALFITPQIILTHCIMFPKSSRNLLLESLKTVPWFTSDIWYNELFENAKLPIAIVTDRLARQDRRFSLVDRVEEPAASVIPIAPIQKPTKVLMIMDHCSTGGMPQYVLRCVEQLKRSGVDVRVVEANYVSDEYVVQRNKLKQMALFYSLNGNKASEIRRIIDEFKPDIVHLQEFPERWAFSDVAIKAVDEIYRAGHPYKIIETSHGSNFEPEQKRYFPDAFSFVSKYHANKFACFNIPYEIVEYTVEPHKRPDRTEALTNLGLDPLDKHILNVGLFTPGKNQAEVFDLARRLPDLKFHFVGNCAPNFKDYWEPLLKDKPANCILWGERADVDAFYSAMDLFLFTSKFELNPLVVKEALSWGMPVLMRALPTYDGFPNGAAVIDDDIDKTYKMLDGIFPSMARRLNRIYTRHV
jgi:autotransporter strand-loop-strand O-heptosyltransferase